MNGHLNNYRPMDGCYTGNAPKYCNTYTSSCTSNESSNYYRRSYSPSYYENTHLRDNKKANTWNRNRTNIVNFQPQRQANYLNVDRPDFENGASSSISSSIDYYNRVYAQVRSTAAVSQDGDSSITSSISKQSRSTPPLVVNSKQQPKFLREPIVSFRMSPQSKSSEPSPLPENDRSLPKSFINNSDPSLDYPYYTMDSLVQLLEPTDTYIPKQSLVYAIFLCSRMHIKPSILLNRLGNSSLNSTKHFARDRGIQLLKNLLYIISQWTRIFPYDFRNTDMINELDDIFNKIRAYQSIFESEMHHIKRKLFSKLQALENYEEYIRQINAKALNSLNHMTLSTDIMNECPTPLLFAQQLTHIELDRLKPIGAEEFIQYFIMKLASEEARAHPNRTANGQSSASANNKLLEAVHDKKLTFCLETYVQWFNRLTFFVTTEIIKHTQKRLRVQLINYFIDSAYECLRLHNFNSMIGIIGGLNKQPVKRLRKTWEKIQLEKFDQLDQYTNVSKNFSNYRLLLKAAVEEAERNNWAVDKIVIPFTSIVVQDVYYIKTHSKDYTVEGGINLKKYDSMAKFISEDFVRYKQSKCSFERNDVIINYITTSPIFNENSLMLASFECEPPRTPNEKKKLTALQAAMKSTASKSSL